jgi:transposase
VPGASVAKVALAHGLNANLVHKWRRRSDAASGAVTQTRQSAFIPLTMAPAQITQTSARDIQIEVRRGATAVTVSWPVAAAAECAAWMRELLR